MAKRGGRASFRKLLKGCLKQKVLMRALRAWGVDPEKSEKKTRRKKGALFTKLLKSPSFAAVGGKVIRKGL